MKGELHSENQSSKISDNKNLYHIHHMHHFYLEEAILHELHHCFLYSREGMKGEKFLIKHHIKDNELHHIINKKYSGIIFDHENNEYKVIDGIISL